jgi:hypothetical protein
MTRAAAFVWLAAACSTHSTGGAQVDASPTSIVLGSPSDSCAGMSTLTGDQALSILMPNYTATYTPISGGAPSALALAVTYNGGAITCHPAQDNPEASQGPLLDLAVHATLSTSDGTFQESFDATITLQADVQSSLAFTATVAIADLHGSFTPAIGGTWDMHDLAFGGQLLAAGTTNGSIEEQAFSADYGQVDGAGSWQ